MTQNKIDLHFLWLLFVAFALCVLSYRFGWAKDARLIRLNDKTMAKIFVTPGRSTILSFPVKPSKTILGYKGSFALEFIENDLAINALSQNARSNLFVYLQGRRYGFDLSTAANVGDSIVLIRDSAEKQMEVKIK